MQLEVNLWDTYQVKNMVKMIVLSKLLFQTNSGSANSSR